MPQRKKRFAKAPASTARKTRSGVIYQPIITVPKPNGGKKTSDDKKEKSSTTVSDSKKTVEPMVTRSHKKFGKFRYLLNEQADINKKAAKKNVSEKPHTIITLEHQENIPYSAPVNVGSVEISTYPDNTSNDDILEQQEPTEQSELNEAQINLIVSGEKHCSVVIQDIVEAEMEYTEEVHTDVQEAYEIVEQLSALNVNSSATIQEEADSIECNLAVENPHVDPEASQQNQEVYQVSTLQSDIVFECISDEVIPIGEEQEVELSNDNDSNIEVNEEYIEIIPVDVQADKEDVLDNKETINFQENLGNPSVQDDDLSKDKGILPEDEAEVVTPEEESLSKTEVEENDCNPGIEEKEVKIESKPKKSVIKQKAKGDGEKKIPQKTQRPPISKPTSSESSVRRSSRIKSISVLKQKSKGHGLVKHKKDTDISPKSTETDTSDNSNSGQGDTEKPATTSSDIIFLTPSSEPDQKPVKVKSRWRRSSELEMVNSSALFLPNRNSPQNVGTENSLNKTNTNVSNCEKLKTANNEVEKRLKQYVHLKENQYRTERVSCKEAKKMTCDCFLTQEEIDRGEYGCGEDCLNRLLMIECGNLCPVGDRCTNKRFQKSQFAPCEAFQTDKKGLGIRASANIPYGEFILEYVGEVLDPEEFDKRATEYSKDKNQHYYFMSLRADAVIDATQKGNISRFINHSCDPNAETQKWTVNGELRIGFFSKRTILAGEEITFDYQFQRYGKEAQKCFCEASTCRGWLGEEPDDYDDDEDEEEEEEDEEEEEEEEENGVKQEVVEKVKEMQTFTETAASDVPKEEGVEEQPVKVETPIKKEKRKVSRPRKARKDIFEDIDPLDDEIESLEATGLKNQAHTLKLSRLIVRAKEPPQRTKLLRLLRRGELPCRRLFLDYHGLRLIHGWMTDAQHMARVDKKLKSLKLEILQTLATLPIPNKTMLQDSKVLPTVEKWSVGDDSIEGSSMDSDSNSPKLEMSSEPKENKKLTKSNEGIKEENKFDISKPDSNEVEASSKADIYQEDMDISPIGSDDKDAIIEVKQVETNLSLPDYDTEIIALALKLLEEWSVLKEVFRIPKKERIEQMKEHEREADRKYRAGLGSEQERLRERSSESWHRHSRRHRKRERSSRRSKERHSSLERYERRRIFAMQIEYEEAERRRKQQEMWRQHEQRCFVMGTDPRFTAPYDPNQDYQCIWNPQTGQWQNYPLPPNHNVAFNSSMSQHSQKLSRSQHIQTSQHLILSNLPTSIQTSNPSLSSGSNQHILSNPQHLSINQHMSSSQHLSVNQIIPLNQPPPTVSGNLTQSHHLSTNQQLQLLGSNNHLTANQLNKSVSSTQHLSLHQHSINQQLTSSQHLISAQQSNQHLSSQQLSLNQQYVSNISIPPNVTVLPNLNIPTSLNVSSNRSITSNLNMPPPNLTLPPNLNLSSTLNLPSNINLPPNLNLPSNLNLNLTSNLGFNVPSNQQFLPNQHLSHNQQIHQQMATNQSQSSTQQMLAIQQLPTSQTVQHLASNNNYSFAGSMIHSSVPPLPSGLQAKLPPPLPALPYQDIIKEKEEQLQVKFMGPIPPPVKLPPKWKCAKDKYGRPYYYHIKIRKSQWEPPEFPPEENNDELSDSTSSSETSSASTDSSSDDSDNSDDDVDDARLLLEMKSKFKSADSLKKQNTQGLSVSEHLLKQKSGSTDVDVNLQSTTVIGDNETDSCESKEKSLDDRLIEEFCLLKKDESPVTKKRRVGLVQEILISPRTEEDRLQFKEDVKRYKANKEKLKRQKELILEQSKKHLNIKVNKPATSKSTKISKKHKITVKTKLKEMVDINSDAAKKIKEAFRSNMAGVMVSILNAYRKPECKEGKITNTDDFKHLARKLTHFVMLKELKHCQNIDDLTCTESVKSKAKEFVRKYMSKFGEMYQRPTDEADF